MPSMLIGYVFFLNQSFPLCHKFNVNTISNVQPKLHEFFAIASSGNMIFLPWIRNVSEVCIVNVSSATWIKFSGEEYFIAFHSLATVGWGRKFALETLHSIQKFIHIQIIALLIPAAQIRKLHMCNSPRFSDHIFYAPSGSCISGIAAKYKTLNITPKVNGT